MQKGECMRIRIVRIQEWGTLLSVFVGFLAFSAASLEASQELGYLLGPGDVVEVSVWKDEELTKTLVIPPDGKFSFPLIGQTQAKGRTLDEVQQDVKQRISEYIPDAPVTVLLREINYPKVYVVGKVIKPGVFLMSGEPLSILQALALSGGMTEFADKGDIIVIRKTGIESQVFHFDYTRVSQGKNLEQNIDLKPGDTVVIP